MIKEIVKNEIKDLIGHQPADAELKSALDYLSDNMESNHKLSDIKDLLYDWRNDCMQQCDECGEYFLELEEFDHNMRVMGKRFCSRQCCDDWEYWNPDEKPEISQHI